MPHARARYRHRRDQGTHLPRLRQRHRAVLWEGKLEVPAQATPMTCALGTRQYVVLADGGSALFRTKTGDSVAYGID